MFLDKAAQRLRIYTGFGITMHNITLRKAYNFLFPFTLGDALCKRKL
ncbi:hypothetical protein MNV_370025 [Candidatus Methanoperedens nitroreducens]|uniref:Uncharacterized protein n=1 Tax=Candidatus Methanoperedens nitratireducens TaxID=1392998 RepID=A0A284VQL2_9EURY|nr:hypothetical protein MNV_370025 [Candidatus Methanoperedens nitroreducens]